MRVSGLIVVLGMVLAASPALAQRSKSVVPPPPGGKEFNSGVVTPAPGLTAPAEEKPAPVGQFKTSRPVAFSLGASMGFASYFAGEVVEAIDSRGRMSIADWLVNAPYGIDGPVDAMCAASKTASGMLAIDAKRALSANMTPSPLKAPPTCEPAKAKATARDADAQYINREQYTAFVALRETWAAQLAKQDAGLAAAFRAGANIAIAEGFASRSTDATAIVRQALTNALPDVKALGLSEARVQEAINFATPGARMSVLHDMVLSMRVSFEATL